MERGGREEGFLRPDGFVPVPEKVEPMNIRNLARAIEILDLDENGCRSAISVGGRVRFVGSRDECARRADILRPVEDRARQDFMLARAIT